MKKLSVWSPRPDALPIEILSPAITIYGLPVINIKNAILNDTQKQTIFSSDALFYVSHYAVKSLCSQMSNNIITKKLNIAIGRKTAEALATFAINPILSTKLPFSSEALLADKNFQSLPFTSIALISGQSGRQLLQRTLQKRGKKVKRIVSYNRDKCNVDPQVMIEFYENYSINAIMLTSCVIVDSVISQLQIAGINKKEFWQNPAFALSQRIADHAVNLGFKNVIVAKNADQQSLYRKMLSWCGK